jgi:aminoglycoside phosphotransferase (APT) family kinase protein
MGATLFAQSAMASTSNRPAEMPRERGTREAPGGWTKAKGLHDLGRHDGFHDRQVDRWTAFLDRIKGRELPGFDVAAAWLRTHRPLDYIPGLMHGDYHFANVMFRHGAPARLAAIVDWEMGTVGDPKLDLGWMLQRWPDGTGSAGAAFPFADLSGMPRQSELGPSYRAQRFGRREAGGAHRRVQSGNSADDGAGHAAQGRKQQRLGQELFDGHSLEIELATP